MSRRNKRKQTTPQTKMQNKPKLSTALVEQTIYQTRQDIARYRMAVDAINNAEFPMSYLLYNLYDYVMDDAVLTSQIENRVQSTLGTTFNLKPKGGDIDTDLTEQLQNSEFMNDIITAVLHTRFYGHSVVELDWDTTTGEQELKTTLIPRQNIIAKKGWFYKNYNDQDKINYRKLPSYGTWLLEFGKPNELGLLKKAIPHALFKRFAQSCWSELCEIYGIPPRVMKTDTQDPQALNRGKQMMQQMGSAAWFIIDSTEEFQWAQGVQTNGDVYNNLIRLCDNNNSLLITGAIVGQDTEHGSYSKDKTANEIKEKLVMADMAMVEMYMNTRVMPALARIGIVPENYVFNFEIAENLQTLWEMTVQALNHYEVDPEWVKTKFGIEILGPKNKALKQQELKADGSFLV